MQRLVFRFPSQLFLTLTILTQFLPIVPAQDDAACTQYNQIDLYVIFDAGFYLPVDTIIQGFQVVRSLIDKVNLTNTRIAFSMGDQCTKALLRADQVVYFKRRVAPCPSSPGLDDNFRFDFSKNHDESLHGQNFFSINTNLDRILKQAIGAPFDTVMRTNYRSSFLGSVEWLKELRKSKRRDAEVGVMVISPAIEANPTLWHRIRSEFEGIGWFVIQICSDHTGTGECPLDFLRSKWVHTLRSGDTIGPNSNILESFCGQLNGCYYNKNETIERSAVCRWNDNGVCEKNVSGVITIYKNSTINGAPCPKNVKFVSCFEYECRRTCDYNDGTRWSVWSTCSLPCGDRGRETRTRRVQRHGLSSKCTTTEARPCGSLPPCYSKTITPTTMSINVTVTTEEDQPITVRVWFYIVISSLCTIILMAFLGVGSVMLWRNIRSSMRRKSKSSSSKKKKKRRGSASESWRNQTFATRRMAELSLPKYSTEKSIFGQNRSMRISQNKSPSTKQTFQSLSLPSIRSKPTKSQKSTE